MNYKLVVNEYVQWKGRKSWEKKQIWYEVQENESIEDCLARMRKDGFMVIGRKEEPLFIVDGERLICAKKFSLKVYLLKISNDFD